MKLLSAAAIIILGAGIIFVLPEESGSDPQRVSAAATPPETTASADESLCDKQAWPYVDRRCARRVEAARGMRKVRIVTDKGHSLTVQTPVPIVEQKPNAAPQPPVVQADRKIGPSVAPVVTDAAPAAAVQTASAQENPAPANPAPARNGSVAPAAASTAPVAPGVDAFADSRGKKSKGARAAEKAEKREAKRRQAIEEENGAVPDEVVTAVEEAAAKINRGNRAVTVDSERGGRRIDRVPRDGGW